MNHFSLKFAHMPSPPVGEGIGSPRPSREGLGEGENGAPGHVLSPLSMTLTLLSPFPAIRSPSAELHHCLWELVELENSNRLV